MDCIKSGNKPQKMYYMPTMGLTYQALSGICHEDHECPHGVFINRVLHNSNAYILTSLQCDSYQGYRCRSIDG